MQNLHLPRESEQHSNCPDEKIPFTHGKALLDSYLQIQWWWQRRLSSMPSIPAGGMVMHPPPMFGQVTSFCKYSYSCAHENIGFLSSAKPSHSDRYLEQRLRAEDTLLMENLCSVSIVYFRVCAIMHFYQS